MLVTHSRSQQQLTHSRSQQQQASSWTKRTCAR
jgi:hypothetical protein